MKSLTFLRSFPVLAAIAALLAACSTSKDASVSKASESASVPGTLEGPSKNTGTMVSADSGMQARMEGMPGMGGMMSGGMMDSMQTQMRAMINMSPSQMKAMSAMHQQMTASMLSQMSSDMRKMNMPADASWTATADSVRQDIARMPEMSAAELKAFLPAHRVRVTRLIESHRAMMGKMKM